MPFSTAGRGFIDISTHNNGGGTISFPGFPVYLFLRSDQGLVLGHPVAFRCERSAVYSGTGTLLPASQHSKVVGGSATINDHDERVAVGLWQLRQRNVEEPDGDEESDTLPSRSSSVTSRTQPASFFVSLSTNTLGAAASSFCP